MKITKYKISIVAIILLILLTVMSIITPGSKVSMDSNSGNDIIGEINNNDVVEETFTTKKNYSHVGIPFANYSQLIDKGYAIIKINKINGKEKRYKVKLSRIMDNEYYFLKYKFKKNKTYKLTITIEKANYPITIYTTTKDTNSELRINNKLRKDNIRLAFIYSSKDYFNIWNYMFILSIVVLYAILIKNSGGKHEK